MAGEAPLKTSVRAMLCPESPRRLPGHRLLGVMLRTAHLLAVGTLLGGHVFDVAAERLVPSLVAAIATGVGMVALELASTCAWLVMGKGLAVLLKLGLLLLVPAFWDQRVFLLVAVTVVAGFGSHMSARFRHYSLLAGREGKAERVRLARASMGRRSDADGTPPLPRARWS